MKPGFWKRWYKYYEGLIIGWTVGAGCPLWVIIVLCVAGAIVGVIVDAMSD